jgi:hypothetical protein
MPVRPRGWLRNQISVDADHSIFPTAPECVPAPVVVPGDSARFDTMSSSDISTRGFHFVYARLSDCFVLGLVCLVAECCVDALIEGASNGFACTMDAFHGALDVVSDVVACVGHY